MICGDTAPQRKPEERGFSVGIIGAGVAGLQQARAFRERGVSVTVFERADNIGGVWRANYSSFGIQVPSQLYDFPDFPLKKRTALGDLFTQDYPSGAEVQAHIEAYADHFELRGLLSLETKVLNVSPRGGAAAGWTFTLERAGKRFTQIFDYAVVATGLYSSTTLVPKLRAPSACTHSAPRSSSPACAQSRSTTGAQRASPRSRVTLRVAAMPWSSPPAQGRRMRPKRASAQRRRSPRRSSHQRISRSCAMRSCGQPWATCSECPRTKRRPADTRP